jgi:Holliday junction DNA helicase RuvA
VIGWLKGRIIEKQAPQLLLDVQGVGYEVHAPMTTFYQLPESGEVELFTHFVVREDAQLLFGFATKDERRLFRSLIKVNGVGPKLALTILSSVETHEFVSCVQMDDVSRLVKIPGIGKKTAERLLVEMRDRLKDWFIESGDSLVIGAEASLAKMQSSHEAEAALVALGYKPAEASKMIATVQKTQALDKTEDLIRAALRQLIR